MLDDSVIGYIKENLGKGYDPKLIKDQLVKEGLPEQEISLKIEELQNGSDNSDSSGASSEDSKSSDPDGLEGVENFGSKFKERERLKHVLGGGDPNNPLSQPQAEASQESLSSRPTEDEESSTGSNQASQSGRSSINTKYDGSYDAQRYDSSKRPPRHVLHASLKGLSDDLESHSRIFIIGLGILVLLVIVLLVTVLFMFTQLKDAYSQDTSAQTATSGPDGQNEQGMQQDSCGYCEYFSDGVCKKYACCANSDCDDGKDDTIDKCVFPSTKDARCIHNNYAAIFGSGAGDSQDETLDEEQISSGDDSAVVENDSDIEDTAPEEDSAETDDTEVNFTDENTTDVEEGSDQADMNGQPCTTSADCDDGKVSTNDMCLGSPDKKCVNIPITSCMPGDGYCPDGCTAENDDDC